MRTWFLPRKYELLTDENTRKKSRNPLIFLLILCVCYVLYRQFILGYTPGSRERAMRQTFDGPIRYLSSDLAAPNRLGNHIFELASLYGMSHQLKRVPVFWIEDENYRSMLDMVKEIMPGLVEQFTVFKGKVPLGVNMTKFHEKCCTFDNPERLESITDQYLHLSGHFYQSWKYFAGRRDEILSFLRPSKHFKILPKSDENTYVTCIHARRGDFAGYGFYAADANFIRKAVEFIENRESKYKKHLQMKTVIFGDDQKFMKDIFPETVASDAWSADVKPSTVHFVSANSPSDDLLYSSQHCDSVLISAPSSTFGWWMGYLSKGNRVLRLDVTTVSDGLYKSGQLKLDDFYLPSWTALRFSADNTTVVESYN